MIINFSNLGSGGGSGSGSTVTWRQDVTAGTQIAQITINGTSQSVYTPDIYTEKSHTEESEEVISRALNELSANAGGGGDSLPEIDTLPENPVDGSVYNYQGRLIKYVDGPGNWGEWLTPKLDVRIDGIGKVSSSLHYGVIPSSVDGSILCASYFSTVGNSPLYYRIDITNACVNVFTDSASTESPSFVILKDGPAVECSNGSNKTTVQWTGNLISIFVGKSGFVGVVNYCSTTTESPHYEPVNEVQNPSKFDTYNPYKEYGYAALFDDNGRVVGNTFPLQEAYHKVNNSNVKWIQRPGWNIPDFYAPTASGETGTILVSAGNTAPVWQTLQTALGIKAIWTGTQDEYDALGTYDNATLYFIVEEE